MMISWDLKVRDGVEAYSPDVVSLVGLSLVSWFQSIWFPTFRPRLWNVLCFNLMMPLCTESDQWKNSFCVPCGITLHQQLCDEWEQRLWAYRRMGATPSRQMANSDGKPKEWRLLRTDYLWWGEQSLKDVAQCKSNLYFIQMWDK